MELSTAFFLTIGLFLFVYGPNAILAGLVVASIFQATAFINIGNSPIIIYYFFGVLLVLRKMLDVVWLPSTAHWPEGNKKFLLWIIYFFMVSFIGSLVLPFIFDNFPVYSPKLSIDEQYNNQTPLQFSFTHLNQLIQLFTNALIVMAVWIQRVPPMFFIKVILFTFVIAIFLACWQLISNISGLYFPNDLFFSVIGWSIGNQQLAGSFLRISSVFLEPSSFSVYLVGIFTFLLVWWIKRPGWIVFLGMGLALFCMLTTLSTTAYLGIMLVILAALCGFGLLQLLNGGWIDRTLFSIFLALVLMLWLVLIFVTASSEFRTILDFVLLEKSAGDSFRARFEADIQSLVIMMKTYGFGLGLGSNRPSSFLAFLISNVGIPGLILFLLFIIGLSRQTLRSAKAMIDPTFYIFALAAVWAVWAVIFAKFFSQPDLSFAPMWIWIFCLVSFCTWQPNSIPVEERRI